MMVLTYRYRNPDGRIHRVYRQEQFEIIDGAPEIIRNWLHEASAELTQEGLDAQVTNVIPNA
jgi:hypothetical protein